VNWLGKISQNRVQGRGQDPVAQGVAAKVDPAKLKATLVSDKVLKKYGAALAPAAGDMQAIARAGGDLTSHRVKQFSNAVDQFYSALGRSTDQLEPDVREAVIKASMGAMRQVVESLAQHPDLMPAMAALSSLLEPRGKHDADPRAHAEAAKKSVLDVVSRFESRLGTSSVLFGFRNLVEGYESSSEGLTAGRRPEIWQAVTDYLEQVVPRPGCNQGQLGIITGLFMRAVRETPDDPKRALQSASQAALEPHVGTVNALLEQLQVEPANLQPGSPGKTAFESMQWALQSVVGNNPAGPEEVFGAIELLQGKLPQAAQTANPEEAKGYQALGKILELAGSTSAVQAVLSYAAQKLPGLVTHAGSRAVLVRAARMQKPESVAPLLLQAHLATLGRNADDPALAAALDKIGRLPPAPALRSALALLPHVHQNYAGPLADALFVESRTADSSEALDAFVTRFVAGFAQMRNQGADMGPVAAALARSGSGNIVPQVAVQLAQNVNNLKARLPDTPIAKVLEQGRNGEAGLIGLSQNGNFLHQPLPVLNSMLEAVSQAGAKKDASADVRIAMSITEQLCQLDRNPAQTDLAQVREDFSAALADAKAFTSAAPGAPAKSAGAFAAAHPDFPIELVFTAGRHLNKPQMQWLQSELSSTRSHAYKRSLRDMVLGVVKADRKDFLDTLIASGADRAAKTRAVEFISVQHRTNQAPQAPWDALVEGLKAGKDPVDEIEGQKAMAAMGAVGLDALPKVDPEGMAVLAKAGKQLKNFLAFNFGNFGKPKEYFTEPLMAAIRSQADGSWPAPKYESESAKVHLAPLQPEQLDVWKTAGVSGAAAPAPIDPAQIEEPLQLLSGLARTLTQHVSIKGKGFEDIGWSQDSFKKLSGQYEQLIGELRNGQKGSKAHRARSKKIGPIRDRLALLELQLELKKHFTKDGLKGDGAAAFRALRPLAQAALPSLRKQGANGFIQAIEGVLDAGPPPSAPTAARAGSYVADDDSLDAWLMAFGGGCLHPENGHNRAALVEYMTGSQYRIVRAFKDDKQVSRSFMRLHRIDAGNGYKGLALTIDPPMAGSAGAPGPQERDAMYRHALKKASAMGLPLFIRGNDLDAAAQEQGLAVHKGQTKVYVHKGMTGMHQSEGLGNYWVSWPGMTGHNYGNCRIQGDPAEAELNLNFSIIMPKG